MSYTSQLDQRAIAISISESVDMPALGLTDEHLRDAMAEIARHLLALGARLVYGGDLRQHGFSELLFELVARHRRDSDESVNPIGVTNYLAWPVHILMHIAEIEEAANDLSDSEELVCLRLDGTRMPLVERRQCGSHQPTKVEWEDGLTAMRRTILEDTDARVVLGGRVDNYKGVMPGIAEEALLSLQSEQPLYLMGGFGGCARDIAETIGLTEPWVGSRPMWRGREAFDLFATSNLNNGLTAQENATLARTSHVDQAVTLILRGLLKILRAKAK